MAGRANRKETTGDACSTPPPECALVGCSPKIVEARDHLARLAANRIGPVLILGETGTGKDRAAKFFHWKSGPRTPFVALNAAATPADLLASNLFGVRRGAFTGAAADRRGVLDEAGDGVVFLDEIGSVSPATQVALLRLVENREYQRVGSPQIERTNALLLFATNADLEAAVAEGRFREDLYWRLDAAKVVLPPLRDRPEDLPALLRHFMEVLPAAEAHRVGIPVQTRGGVRWSGGATRLLASHPWPGNVRELVHVVGRTLLSLPEGRTVIRRGDVRLEVPGPSREDGAGESLDDALRRRVRAALRSTGGNIAAAARSLRCSVNRVRRRMRPTRERSDDERDGPAPRSRDDEPPGDR